MISIQNELSYQEFLSDLSGKLGFEIDQDSFDNSFLKILFNYTSDNNKRISDKINSRMFENLNGRNLNEFMSFFNVKRRAGTSGDVFNFEIYMNDNKSIKIKSGSVFEFEKNRYELIRDEFVSKELNNIKAILSFNTKQINEPCYFNGGTLVFDKDAFEINGETNTQAYISKNLKMVSYERSYSEVESDFEFLERSKSIMQSFGYSNNKKIELELTKDSRVRDIYIDELNGIAEITLIPYKLEELEDIINSAKEIVDYYKGSRVDLVRPSMVELYVENLQSEIVFHSRYEEIHDKIMEELSVFVASNFDKTIYKNKIIEAIRSAVYSLDFNVDINFNKINVKYDFYNNNNYSIPMINDSIEESKEFHGGTVIAFKEIR